MDDCSMSLGACSRGRCVTAACATTERDRTTFSGCLFYTAEVDNVASDAAMPMSFLVTNAGADAATVTLEQAMEDGTWMPTGAPVTIAGGGVGRLSVAGFKVEGSGVKIAGALRVSSSQPVTVAQIQSDDSGQNALSSGGTMVLPAHVLGQHYLAMTYPQVDTPAIDATPGGAGGPGRVLVVGTQPATHVTFIVSRSASAVVAGTLATVMHDIPYEFDLGEGDVFQAWSGGDKQDLSGSEIFADQPVAVFSGNITTTYGKTASGINSPDMVHEQMPPVFAWSYKYVAASLPPEAATCDTLLGTAGASVWRMMAVNDNTRIDFTWPANAPSPPPPAPPPLSAGEVVEIVAVGDFVVSANWPLLMTQGIDCEPSLSLAISADKMLDDLTFAVLPSFDQVIAVARMNDDQIVLDGVPIDDRLFSPAGGVYQVARVQLQPPCPASQQVCQHRLQGKFGMTMRGMDVLASYALTAPAWTGCIDPLTCVM